MNCMPSFCLIVFILFCWLLPTEEKIMVSLLVLFTLLLQADEKILESYAKSWTSGVLDKAAQRDSMSYTLAKHHLSGFVFQCRVSGKTLRYKVVKSLLRCYAQKRHHEVNVRSGFLQALITRQSPPCLLNHAPDSHCLEYPVQQAMLKSFVLQGIAQDPERSSNELDQRFEILKDACEMNSSLLAEVQRLKASLGQ
jgi:RNA polymerase II-associated protein 1